MTKEKSECFDKSTSIVRNHPLNKGQVVIKEMSSFLLLLEGCRQNTLKFGEPESESLKVV
jgi:hypothetical protein